MSEALLQLRERLVRVALEWERTFGVAPAITSTLSELDGALLVGMSASDYAAFMQGQTAVSRGLDFVFQGVRYQVKANRPSGKPGSRVTLVAKAKNYDWDRLIWVHYTTGYELAEAFEWSVDDYRLAFDHLKRLSPAHYREGRRLL